MKKTKGLEYGSSECWAAGSQPLPPSTNTYVLVGCFGATLRDRSFHEVIKGPATDVPLLNTLIHSAVPRLCWELRVCAEGLISLDTGHGHLCPGHGEICISLLFSRGSVQEGPRFSLLSVLHPIILLHALPQHTHTDMYMLFSSLHLLQLFLYLGKGIFI